jgi:hypothetical protein
MRPILGLERHDLAVVIRRDIQAWLCRQHREGRG